MITDSAKVTLPILKRKRGLMRQRLTQLSSLALRVGVAEFVIMAHEVVNWTAPVCPTEEL